MIEKLLEVVYRKKDTCYFCGYLGDYVKNNACSNCRLRLYRIDHERCTLCGKPIRRTCKALDQCRDCEQVEKFFDRGLAPFIYHGYIKKYIHDYKYHDKTYLRDVFAQYMVEELLCSDMEYVDIIVPVPLHPSRENMRGYNQAELLSGYVSKKLDIRHESKNLIRVLKNSVQKDLSKHQRAKNLQDAFSIKHPEAIRDKKILLVDDIYTTGATVNQIAKKLKESKAKSVTVVTIATTREKIGGNQNGTCKL